MTKDTFEKQTLRRDAIGRINLQAVDGKVVISVRSATVGDELTWLSTAFSTNDLTTVIGELEAVLAEAQEQEPGDRAGFVHVLTSEGESE